MKKKKFNILIRTAGGKAPKKELGMGHVYRSLNLANYLSPNKIFFLLEDYGDAKKIIKLKKFNIFNLKKNESLKKDVQKTIALIIKNKVDLVIVDKYKVKNEYIEKIRKIVKVVVISDLKKILYNADLVVSGFVGYENRKGKNGLGVKCLLGPKYQILNPAFSKSVPRQRKKYRLLITMGGFDENNITELIIKKLIRKSSNFKTRIVLGPINRLNKNAKNFQKKYQKKLSIINETKNMRKEIGQSEFGICAGGITSYEFASMKVPFAIISQVPHQQITANEWNRKKIALNLGLIGNQTVKKLDKLLTKLEDNKPFFNYDSKQVIDGIGGKRVAKEIIKLIK